MKYADIYMRLSYETAVVVFLKKDGSVRLLLGTRNLSTISLMYGFQGTELGKMDFRCNINNGNIALFDLIIGEARQFNIDRLIDIQFAGNIDTKEKLDDVFEKFNKFKKEYEATKPMSLDMNTFDNTNIGGNL